MPYSTLSPPTYSRSVVWQTLGASGYTHRGSMRFQHPLVCYPSTTHRTRSANKHTAVASASVCPVVWCLCYRTAAAPKEPPHHTYAGCFRHAVPGCFFLGATQVGGPLIPRRSAYGDPLWICAGEYRSLGVCSWSVPRPLLLSLYFAEKGSAACVSIRAFVLPSCVLSRM